MSNPPASSPLHRGYAFLVTAASYLQSPLLLAIRLFWGWQFIGTGLAKLQGHDAFVEHFAEWHVPLPSLSVWMAGTTEFVGGALLLIGLASRLASIPLIGTMVVAYVTAEPEALHAIFEDPDKFMGATPFLFLFACVIILAFGPGVFSVDYLLGRKFGARR